MAELVQQKCLNCKKMGMIRCDGCTRRFCSIHLMNIVSIWILYSNVFVMIEILYANQINNPHSVLTSNKSQITSLLDEITAWENETLKMVKQTAERARQQVNELMISNKKPLQLN